MAKQIIPKDFYVYAHHKASTGEIFYQGKGHGNRAWAHGNRSDWWKSVVAKHGLVVVIVQDGLQEWAAFELECGLIALHGRKDLGRGPLVNMTDGGEGASNPPKHVRDTLSRRRSALNEDALFKAERRSQMIKLNADPEFAKQNSLRRTEMNADPAFKAGRRAHMLSLHSNQQFSESLKVRAKELAARSGFVVARAKSIAATHSDPMLKTKRLEALRRAKNVKIVCVELNKEFESIKAATAWLREIGFKNASTGCVSQAVNGKRKTVHGYRFERIEKESSCPTM